MPLTQHRYALFGQRYGSFFQKNGEHPVEEITQARFGLFGQRYGSFSGKLASQKLQMRYALFGQPYGSFADKEETEAPAQNVSWWAWMQSGTY